jgi:hypothetical protein
MKLRIKDTRTTLLIIGIYQIVGSVLGFALIASILMRTGDINGPVLLIFIIALALYSLSLNSGILIIQTKSEKKGIIFSMINQIVQFISFAVAGNKYDLVSGIRGGIGIDVTNGFNFKFNVGLTSTFNFSINTSDKEYFIYVNVFAIFIFLILSDILKEKKLAFRYLTTK